MATIETLNVKDKQEQPEEESAEQSSKSEVEIVSGARFYQNPANGERSFIMLKPDAVQRGLVGQIVARYIPKQKP